MEEGFKPTQVVKIKNGDGSETTFPVYDLNVLRAGILYTDDIPPEIPQQIIDNCKRVPGRLELHPEPRDEPIAIVGYGPSLKEYWQELRKFPVIMSTSGAHKFLLDRDIIPTYHVDVDFRARKAVHTKPAHPDVEYLLSSMVHSDLLDNVQNYRHKLWHIKLSGIKYPEGDLVLDGYWDVGQEAILVAKALGYRNLHLFAYDYAYDMSDGSTHAGFHYGPPSSRIFAKIGERFYFTSDSLARGVMTFTKLMEDNSDLRLNFYTDGLLTAFLTEHYKEAKDETKHH